MNTVLFNFLLFLAISFIIYLFFMNYNTIEGMTTSNSNKQNNTNMSNSNGIAANAANYTAQIKTETIKLQDILLITKYRKDYESAIIALDEMVDILMLKTVLDVDRSNPEKSLEKLVNLNQSKSALNNVMKFVDKN
jgi:hypothetical protein